MTPQQASLPNPLVRKLESLGPLLEEERRAVEGVLLHQRPVPADQDLVCDGERPVHCLLLLEGMACRYKVIEGGRRQIISFHVAGDILDLTQLLVGRADHAVASLTPVRVAAIPHATILDWIGRLPNLTRLLWRDTLLDAAVFREWVVNVGRRSAAERIAHLLCELATRLRAAGLAGDDGSYALPLTQAELADATGLSVVHVSRTLQELRATGLVEFRGGTLAVRDWERLKRRGGFDPGYLHQLADAAAAA